MESAICNDTVFCLSNKVYNYVPLITFLYETFIGAHIYSFRHILTFIAHLRGTHASIHLLNSNTPGNFQFLIFSTITEPIHYPTTTHNPHHLCKLHTPYSIINVHLIKPNSSCHATMQH